MKRILITGAGSYIGTSVERYLMKYNASAGRECYRVDTISLREESWENYDFSLYDTVFHVAGIAHADVSRVSEEAKAQYYAVNRDLAVKTALKAREQGVGQFIYMSSVIVFGDSAPPGGRKCIDSDTPPAPSNFYGDSKLQAEIALRALESCGFHVALLRCPMIYGEGSRGNYPLLVSLARHLPVFPDISNERSMLYVVNLAEFVRLLTEKGCGGFFYPQNREIVSTPELVEKIALAMGRKLHRWKILNPLVVLAAHFPGRVGALAGKAFGSLTIDPDLSLKGIDEYQIYSLEASIKSIT